MNRILAQCGWLLLAACGILLIGPLAHGQEEPAKKEPAAVPAIPDSPVETPAEPKVTNELPPEKKPEDSAEVAPFKSAREFLALRGIDESFFRFLVDGEKFGAGERETLYKLLDSMPDLTPIDFHAWKREASWQQIVDKPADYRLEAISVPLRVKQFSVGAIPRELAGKVDFKNYYQVQGELADRPGCQVVIFTRSIPKAWEDKAFNQPLDEMAVAEAVFLKVGEKGSGELPTLYFVAPRIGWMPDKPNKTLGVPAAWVSLAKRGFDVSRFEEVRDRSKIGVQEREGFYEMLAAIGKMPPESIVQAAPEHSDLGVLVNKPGEMRGELATIEGRCRRATKIMVTAPDIQARFGIKHYYELMIFLDEKVRFQQPDSPDKVVEFNSYPVVCCVLELPPQVQENIEINEQLRVSGYYFKLWAYSSQFMAEEQKRLGLTSDMQLSPLLVGVRPLWIRPRKPETNVWIAGSIAGAVVALIAIGGFGAWSYHSPAAELAKKQVGPIGPPPSEPASSPAE